MASWQFRCVCCGELRDAPMARPEGTVYLRCVATREWAWYEPSAFVLAAVESAPAVRDAGDRRKPARSTGRTRVAARIARTAGGRRPRVAARSARGGTGRKVAKRPRKRR